MPLLFPLAAVSLIGLSVSQAPTVRAPVCGAPDGLHRVALTPTSCCKALPCERPLTFGPTTHRPRGGRT